MVENRSLARVVSVPLDSGNNTDAPEALAVNPLTNKAYVVNNRAFNNQILVFDLRSNQVTSRIELGKALQSLAVAPTFNRIYVTTSDDLTIINGATNTVLATIPLPHPQNVAVNERTGRVYVTTSDPKRGGMLSVLDDTAAFHDTTPPTVTLGTPLNNQAISSLSTIAGTAIDNMGGSGVSRVSLLLQRMSDGQYWNGLSWNKTPVALPTILDGDDWARNVRLPGGNNLTKGQYQLVAIALDMAGNRASTSNFFSVH